MSGDKFYSVALDEAHEMKINLKQKCFEFFQQVQSHSFNILFTV
jgi:hypothetical protein